MANDNDATKHEKGGKNLEEKLSFSKLKKIDSNTLHSDAIKIAWKTVRDLVALRLMGNRGCAVPYLHDATRYGLLNVLVKEKKSMADKIAHKPGIMHWSAPLEDILPDNVPVKDFRAHHHTDIVEEDSRDMIQYHVKNTDGHHSSSHTKSTTEKKYCDVEVKLFNTQHYKVNGETTETPVSLKHFAGVENIEKIFLITEVYVTSKMVMNVRVGERNFSWDSQTMIPVGIVFRKCEMTPGGILRYGEEVERKKAIEYRWVASNHSKKHSAKEM